MQALLGGLMGGGQPQMPQQQEQREDQAKWQKFEAPPNEMLDKEGSYKDMKPTNKDLSKFIQRNLQSAIVNAANKQERAVYQQIAKQMEVDESKEKFTDLYNETFILWLLGKSHYNKSKKDLYQEFVALRDQAGLKLTPNGQTLQENWEFLKSQDTFEKYLKDLDFNPTPWGNKNISFLPGCKEFLDSIVDKRAEVEKYFAKIALNGPRNITDAWMIYKYVIHKNEIDDTIIDYAKSIVGPYDVVSQEQVPNHMMKEDLATGDYEEIASRQGDYIIDPNTHQRVFTNKYAYKYYQPNTQPGQAGYDIITSLSQQIVPDVVGPKDIPPPYSMAQTEMRYTYLAFVDEILHNIVTQPIDANGNAIDMSDFFRTLKTARESVTAQMDPLEGIYFDMEVTESLSSRLPELMDVVYADQQMQIAHKEKAIEELVRLKTIFPSLKISDEGSQDAGFNVQGNMVARMEAALQALGERIVNHLRASGLRPVGDNGLGGPPNGPLNAQVNLSDQLEALIQQGINLGAADQNNQNHYDDLLTVLEEQRDLIQQLVLLNQNQPGGGGQPPGNPPNNPPPGNPPNNPPPGNPPPAPPLPGNPPPPPPPPGNQPVAKKRKKQQQQQQQQPNPAVLVNNPPDPNAPPQQSFLGKLTGGLVGGAKAIGNLPAGAVTLMGPVFNAFANNVVNQTVAAHVPKSSGDFLMKFIEGQSITQGKKQKLPKSIPTTMPSLPSVVESAKEVMRTITSEALSESVIKRFHGKSEDETIGNIKDVMQLTYAYGMQALQFAANDKSTGGNFMADDPNIAIDKNVQNNIQSAAKTAILIEVFNQIQNPNVDVQAAQNIMQEMSKQLQATKLNSPQALHRWLTSITGISTFEKNKALDQQQAALVHRGVQNAMNDINAGTAAITKDVADAMYLFTSKKGSIEGVDFAKGNKTPYQKKKKAQKGNNNNNNNNNG